MTSDGWLVISAALIGAALGFLAGRLHPRPLARWAIALTGVAVAVFLGVKVSQGSSIMSIVVFAVALSATFGMTLRTKAPGFGASD